MVRSLALAVVVAPFALAACGGGGGGGSSTPTPSPSPTATPPVTSGPTIVIQGLTFNPQSLEVAPGDVVRVVNADSEVHSVTSQAAPSTFTPGAVNGISFDTGLFLGTRTFTIPANAAVGTVVPYFCSSHLAMMGNGEIRVVADPEPVEPVIDPRTGLPY